MSTAAEQYRNLVNRLERIVNEELKIGDIDPRNGKKIISAMTDGSGNVVRSGTGEIWNVKYGEPDAPAAPATTPAAEPEQPAVPAEEPATVTPVTSNDVNPEPIPAADVSAPTPDNKKPEEKCGPEVKEKIKQQKTFNAAFKMATQAGCPDFDWCQIVKVPGQAPTPAPAPVQGVTTNPMGDFDPTSFSGDFTRVREDTKLKENRDHHIIVNGKPVDVRSLEIDNVDTRDYPDFSDAYITYGEFTDGTEMSDSELEELTDKYGEIVNQLAHDSLHESSIEESAFIPGSEELARMRELANMEIVYEASGEIPEIKAPNKDAAIAIARKKGIKVFRFCGKYKTKIGKKPKQAPTPVPKPQPKKEPVQGVTTNPMGDFDPTSFSGDFTRPR